MKIGITADSSSGLEYVDFKHDVRITKTTINFKDNTLTDGIDITADSFYELLQKKDEIPSTSAPSPEEILSRIQELINEGCTDIIHFPISTGLSDYGKNLALQLSEKVNEMGANFYVYDSKTACLMEGLTAVLASLYAKKGLNIAEIFKKLDDFRAHQFPFFVVNDLRYLIKNGRLSVLAGNIGIFLKIKPILIINAEGKIVTYEKVRTLEAAHKRMLELAIDAGNNASDVLYLSLHTARLDEAIKNKEKLDSLSNCFKTVVSTITPTVGAHIGSGIVGVAAMILNQEEKELFSEIL